MVIGNFFIKTFYCSFNLGLYDIYKALHETLQTYHLSQPTFFILEYGSELMSQQEFKQPMDRLSEQLLFQGQNKNLHSNNTTNERFLQGAAGYCNFPNPASIKEGIARWSNLLK